MVIHCKTTNWHGFLLSNAYMCVIQLLAKILTSDNETYLAFESSTTYLLWKANKERKTMPQHEHFFPYTNGETSRLMTLNTISARLPLTKTV